tara:strand:+ start:85048 stop:85227 length:180 start_codon:yes stop_codon:yes gene_type:complete
MDGFFLGTQIKEIFIIFIIYLVCGLERGGYGLTASSAEDTDFFEVNGYVMGFLMMFVVG